MCATACITSLELLRHLHNLSRRINFGAIAPPIPYDGQNFGDAMRFLTQVLVISPALLLAACGDTVGTTVTNSLPTASISASPTAATSGGESTLTWSSTNATSCSASGGWSGAKATSGTQSTGARTATTSYSLSCSG